MSHFYDVSGKALNWNGLCMCGIYDLYDTKWPLLEVLRSFTLNLEWPRCPYDNCPPNQRCQTVRTDGNTSNKMSDILSDIKYTVPYTPSTCRCHSALEIFLKNINKKMNKKCHWNASSNFWKLDWFMGRFFVLTYFEIWMLQICVYTYVYPR